MAGLVALIVPLSQLPALFDQDQLVAGRDLKSVAFSTVFDNDLALTVEERGARYRNRSGGRSSFCIKRSFAMRVHSSPNPRVSV